MSKKRIEIENSFLEKRHIPDSSNPNERFSETGFFIKPGKYFIKSSIRKGELVDSETSNFLVNSLYNLVNGANNSSKVICIQGKPGGKILVDINSCDLVLSAINTSQQKIKPLLLLQKPGQNVDKLPEHSGSSKSFLNKLSTNNAIPEAYKPKRKQWVFEREAIDQCLLSNKSITP